MNRIVVEMAEEIKLLLLEVRVSGEKLLQEMDDGEVLRTVRVVGRVMRIFVSRRRIS